MADRLFALGYCFQEESEIQNVSCKGSTQKEAIGRLFLCGMIARVDSDNPIRTLTEEDVDRQAWGNSFS